MGSTKPATWPEASHTLGEAMMEESSPTTSSRPCTMSRHHRCLMLFFSSTVILGQLEN